MSLFKAINEFDIRASRKIASYQHSALSKILLLVTYSGTGFVWFGAGFTLWFFQSRGIEIVPFQRQILRALLAPLIAWVIGKIIKRVVKRARPEGHDPRHIGVVRPIKHDSFPSNHAAASFAFFTVLTLMGSTLAPIVGVWACCTSFSRIYFRVHYPSDILAGALLGVISAFALQFMDTVLFFLRVHAT